MDRHILDLRPENRLAVAILPTAAAAQRPELAAANGVRHFEALDASVEPVMAVDERSANDPRVLQPLAEVGLIYFAGGSPTHLLRVLRETRLWEAVRSAWAAGTALAGSSAGAMVMGEWMLAPGDPRSWVQTLAAVPGVAVLPHFERWTPQQKQHAVATRPEGIVLAGVPGAGGVVVPRSDHSAHVIGERAVTVVTARGDQAVLRPGEAFPAPSP